MRYPKLNVPAKRRVLIDRFRGYEHLPEPSVGAFYDMQNLSGERSPLLTVRPRRTQPALLDASPASRVLALGGRGSAVILDIFGTLWCGGVGLAELLNGNAYFRAMAGEVQVPITDLAAVRACVRTPGYYCFRYHAATNRWRLDGSNASLSGAVFTPAALTDGMELELSYSYILQNTGQRQLVFLGGWVCVFPDGKFCNTVKLRQGSSMTEGEDYGDIAQFNSCDEGGTLFTPCDEEGRARTVLWSDTAPAQGCWVDTSELTPTLRTWSQSQGLWVELTPYVKCQVPGIAKGLRAGDSVELVGRLQSNQGGESEVEGIWTGVKVLAGAWHDPGAGSHIEGRDDYLILPGLLPQSYEIELTWHDQSFLNVTRPIPEMDFVVEAGNRLWGCRRSGEINELYGSKLGDFRNWYAFEGLSTDSYRVARGSDGAYTGAAVLGGCPLFFRADCLEKIYPSAAGDHGVVTVSLEGIAPGCANSAVVIRDQLYYKSPGGICRYNGTLPVRVSQALGDTAYHGAVAGARGALYYLSMLDSREQGHLFVLNTETGLWYREDDLRFAAAYTQGELLYLLPYPGTGLLCVGEAKDSRDLRWWAETGELAPRMARSRYVTRLRLTARLELGAELRVCLSLDGGPWLPVGSFRGEGMTAQSYSIPDQRCQRLRLRLEGRGGMELQSLSWLTEAGSDL